MVFNNEFASSAITEASYDTENSTLSVTFRRNGTDGSTYDYHNVPFSVYKGLVDAPSAGRYLNRQVIGQYDFD